MEDSTNAKLIELYQLEVAIASHRKALNDCQLKAKKLKQELGKTLSLVAKEGTVLLVPELTAQGQGVWVDDWRCDDPISFVELAHV
jgi:hypothetical protein